MVQVIKLTGVVDDGSARHPLVPANSARSIQFPKHSDVSVLVEVVTNANVPVDLLSGSWSAHFSVASHPGGPSRPNACLPLQVSSTALRSGSSNVILFTLNRALFRNLDPGRYYYDISLTYDGEKHQIVRVSGLHLEMALRKA
jgi:hypothetical protein